VCLIAFAQKHSLWILQWPFPQFYLLPPSNCQLILCKLTQTMRHEKQKHEKWDKTQDTELWDTRHGSHEMRDNMRQNTHKTLHTSHKTCNISSILQFSP
jgi:hypothetical protein